MLKFHGTVKLGSFISEDKKQLWYAIPYGQKTEKKIAIHFSDRITLPEPGSYEISGSIVSNKHGFPVMFIDSWLRLRTGEWNRYNPKTGNPPIPGDDF